MPENPPEPDVPGEGADRPTAEPPGESGEDQARASLDIPEWVSELRRLYVEPKTRAEVRQARGAAPQRRKLSLPRGRSSAQNPSATAPAAETHGEAPSPLEAIASGAHPEFPHPTDQEPEHGATGSPVPPPAAVEASGDSTEETSPGSWLVSYLAATGHSAEPDDADVAELPATDHSAEPDDTDVAQSPATDHSAEPDDADAAESPPPTDTADVAASEAEKVPRTVAPEDAAPQPVSWEEPPVPEQWLGAASAPAEAASETDESPLVPIDAASVSVGPAPVLVEASPAMSAEAPPLTPEAALPPTDLPDTETPTVTPDTELPREAPSAAAEDEFAGRDGVEPVDLPQEVPPTFAAVGLATGDGFEPVDEPQSLGQDDSGEDESELPQEAPFATAADELAPGLEPVDVPPPLGQDESGEDESEPELAHKTPFATAVDELTPAGELVPGDQAEPVVPETAREPDSETEHHRTLAELAGVAFATGGVASETRDEAESASGSADLDADPDAQRPGHPASSSTTAPSDRPTVEDVPPWPAPGDEPPQPSTTGAPELVEEAPAAPPPAAELPQGSGAGNALLEEPISAAAALEPSIVERMPAPDERIPDGPAPGERVEPPPPQPPPPRTRGRHTTPGPEPVPVAPGPVGAPEPEQEPVAASASEAEPVPEPGPSSSPPRVTLSWRQAESLDFGLPSVDDEQQAIVVEPPSQLVARPRRRRPEPTVYEDDEYPDDEVAPEPGPPAPVVEPEPVAESGGTDAETSRPSTTRWVALVVGLLLVLAVLVWFFLLRGS